MFVGSVIREGATREGILLREEVWRRMECGEGGSVMWEGVCGGERKYQVEEEAFCRIEVGQHCIFHDLVINLSHKCSTYLPKFGFCNSTACCNV